MYRDPADGSEKKKTHTYIYICTVKYNSHTHIYAGIHFGADTVLFTYSFFFLTSFRRTRESQKEVKTDYQREYKSIFPEVKKFAAKGKAVTYTNRSLYTDIAELDDLFRARKFANYFRCGKPNKHRKRS